MTPAFTRCTRAPTTRWTITTTTTFTRCFRAYISTGCAFWGFGTCHPGSLDTFSSDDDRTNHSFAEVIGNGAVSMLVNLDPTARLTCYYLSKNGEYRTVPVMVGDKYFAGSRLLELTTPEALLKNKDRLQAEIFDPEEA